MKKLLFFIFCLVTSVTYAYDFEVDGLRYNILPSTGREVQLACNAGGSGYSGEIVIPETVNYEGEIYTVVDIENEGNWLYGGAFCQTTITGLSIPKTIKNIPDFICMDCWGLTNNLIISEGIETIGSGAFYCCPNLNELNLPNSLTSIGSMAFAVGVFGQNECLKNVVIPNRVTSIGGSCFERCVALESITLGEKVSSIGWDAFSECESLSMIKCLNATPASIGNATFSETHYQNARLVVPAGSLPIYKSAAGWCNFKYITEEQSNKLYYTSTDGEVVVPTHYNFGEATVLSNVYENGYGCITFDRDLVEIGDGAFNQCHTLSGITFPASLTKIGEWAFNECAFESLYIPGNVKTISGLAFHYCSQLSELTLAEGIEYIGGLAFEGCDNVTSLHIPSTVKDYGGGAVFWIDNNQMTSITVAEGNEFYDSRNNCNAIIRKSDNCLLFGCESTVIPEGIRSIDGYAFYGCLNMTEMHLPKSVIDVRGDRTYGEVGYFNRFRDIYSYANNPPFFNVGYADYINKECVLHVPAHSLAKYQSADFWKEFTNIEVIPTMPVSHEYVDLGLPSGTLWATTNVGAYSPEEIGDYYAWGETVSKNISKYNTNGYKYFDNNSSNWSKYCSADGKSRLELLDDAASVNWGTDWRTPTSSEVNELIENCDFTYAELGGTIVTKCTSRANGNSVYFPITGFYENGNIECTDRGFYQTSDGCGYNDEYGGFNYLNIQGIYTCTYTHGRGSGFQVRPVRSSSNPTYSLLYTTRDNNIVDPADVFNAHVIDNTFVNGVGTLTFDAEITSIGANAFNGSSLQTIIIPSSVSHIDASAFEGCEYLREIVVSAENTVYDSRNNCNAVIETASSTLVAGCQTTVIPKSVKHIGASAFRGCQGLKAISIPGGVSTIGECAFEGTGLNRINVYSQTPAVVEDLAFYGVNKNACQLNVLYGSLTAYRNASGWRDFLNVVENTSNVFFYTTVDEQPIHAGRLRECYKEISSTYENGQGCLIFDEDIEFFPGDAFDGVDRLISLVIPAKVNKFEGVAFRGCSNLVSLSVDPENQTFDSRNNCNAIIETATNTLVEGSNATVIPSDIVAIRGNAFDGRSNLVDIELPEGLKRIGWDAFIGCNSLTNVYVPASVDYLDSCPWRGSGVKYITVSPENKTYDSRNNCNAIIETATNTLVVGSEECIIPKSVKRIGSFSLNVNRESIDIPASVIEVGGSVFSNSFKCINTYAVEPPVMERIWEYVDLNTCALHVPAGTLQAYQEAEGWKDFATIIDDLENLVTPTDTALYDNIVYIQHETAWGGDKVKLHMNLKNAEENIMGFQFKLYLPEGISLDMNNRGRYDIKFNAEADRSSSQYHTLSSALQPDGSVLVLCYSSDLNIFLGHEGAVLDLAVTLSEDIEAGDHAILMRDVVITDVDSKKSTIDVVVSNVTVPDYTIGDPDNSGSIDISDIAIVANYILGNNPEGFIYEAADVNGDGVVDVVDIACLANLILYGQPTH